MAKTNWLKTLRAHFPEITFKKSDAFCWSPVHATVYTGSLENESDLVTLLHETGHALAGHTTYPHDIELLKLEREAWEIARTRIAPLFDIKVKDETIEEALDSYREWLHARSICPACDSTGVQQDESRYRCLACATIWKVNDARTCQLRRYITK